MKLIALLMAIVLLAGCSTATIKNGQVASKLSVADAPSGYTPGNPMFQFAGAWEGTLEGHSGPNLVAGAGVKRAFRIVIEAQQVHVFQQLNSRWSEMKPGTFTIYNWSSQAVIYSLTSGNDKDGTWVEGSSFTLVHNSPSSVIAYWLRTVNNLNLPPHNPDFHFAWEFSGQMQRVGK